MSPLYDEREDDEMSETSPLLVKVKSNGHGLVEDNEQPLLEDSDLQSVPAYDDDDDFDKPKIPGVDIKYIIPALGIGIFLAAMDNTIVVSSYGVIGTDLKALNKTSWIATAYLLTTTSFQPLYGKLSDIFGRKQALLFAYAIFGLGCLFCGLSQSLGQIVAARAFAGIGGGGMTTVVSILMSDIVPLRSRGTWQGLLNIIFASGAAVGAPLGGMMADSIGWRWAFILQFPMTLIAIIVVSINLHLPHTPTSENATAFKARLKRVDFVGAGTLILAVLTLLIGLDLAGNSSLKDPIAIVSLLVSLILFGAFILVENKVAAEPFAPPHIVKERTIFAACLSNFCSFGSHMVVLFYIPLYYQVVESLSAGQSGLRLLPAIVGGVTGSLGGGIIMQKTGRYYWITVGGYSGVVIGSTFVFLFTGTVLRSITGVSFAILSSGFGNGIGVTTTLIAVIAAAGSDDQAVATAVSYLFRALGTVFGVSVSSMLVQGSLRRDLNKHLDGENVDEIVNEVRGSMDFIKTLPPDTRHTVVVCYENAINAAFIFAITLAVGAVISSAFIKEKKLSR